MAVSDNLEEIKAKAKKLKALADKGMGGEKANAKRMLDELLKANNLEWKDVDDSRLYRYIKVPNMHEGRRLMMECIFSVVPEAKIQENIAKKVLKVKLEDTQYIEVLDKFQYFWTNFQKDREILLIAYFNKYKKFFIREMSPPNPYHPDGTKKTPHDLWVESMELQKEQDRMSQMDDEETFFGFGGSPNPDHNKKGYGNHGDLTKTESTRIIKMMSSLADLYYVKSSKTITDKKKT